MFDLFLERRIVKELKKTFSGSVIQVTIWTDSEIDKVEAALQRLKRQGKVTEENGRWFAVED